MTQNCESLRQRLTTLRERAIGLEHIVERYDIAMAHSADRAADDERYDRYFEKQSPYYDELQRTLQEIKDVAQEITRLGCIEVPGDTC